MPKLVELYGSVSSISANSESPIISWRVPSGYVAELVAVGVIPDFDPDTKASNLDGVTIAAGDTETRVGTKFPHSNFSANHNGMNSLPYGDRASRIEDYEVITVSRIGVKPHANAGYLRLFDDRNKVEFPDREPYWRINETDNVLPFGDDEDFQPMAELPDFVKMYPWTKTILKIQIQDTGTAIPVNGVRVQLFGVYRSGR